MRALIIVEGKLAAGVVFPEAGVETENKYPHLSLLLNRWPAKHSNLVLEQTCGVGSVFHNAYEKVKEKTAVAGVLTAVDVPLLGQKYKVHFISLEKPFVFSAVHHAHF